MAGASWGRTAVHVLALVEDVDEETRAYMLTWLCAAYSGEELEELVRLVEARVERELDQAGRVIGEVELPLD